MSTPRKRNGESVRKVQKKKSDAFSAPAPRKRKVKTVESIPEVVPLEVVQETIIETVEKEAERPVVVQKIAPVFEEKKIITRKKESRVIEIDIGHFHFVVGNFFRNINTKFGLAGICTLLVFLVFLTFHAKSDITRAELYASTCLGSWQNPEQAEGIPDVAEGATYFTRVNSAYTSEANQQIYCGDFKGDTPPDSVAKKFKLKLSWLVTANATGVAKVQPSAVEQTTETQAVEQSAETSTTTSSTSDVPESPSAVEENQLQAPAEETAPTESGPTSFFYNLFSIARADDSEVVAPVENAPVQSEQVSEQATPIENTQETQSEVTTSPTDENIESVNATVTPVENPEDTIVTPHPDVTEVVTVPTEDIMEVLYTIDGNTWKTLGKVNAENWRTHTFEIADADVQTWDDLSRLQISVRTLTTDGVPPVIYLDSAYIEVEYETVLTEEQNATTPVVELKDSADIDIVAGDDVDFSTNETPTFVIVDPKLSKNDLRTLVKEDKAEVVSDPAGILDAGTIVVPSSQVETSNQPAIATNPVQNATTEINPVGVPDLSPLKNAVENIVPTISLPENSSTDSGSVLTAPQIIPSTTDTVAPVSSAPQKNYVLAFLKKLINAEKVFADDDETAGRARVADVSILDPFGKEAEVGVTLATVTIDGVDHQEIKIDKPEHEFKPGKYTLRLTLTTGDTSIVSEQDFTWGVLAVNFNQTVYEVDDRAYIQLAALTNTGHTICDAQLKVTILDPDSSLHTFRTSDGTIANSDTCGADNVTDSPDYYFHYTPDTAGTYQVLLTDEISGRKIRDSFSAVRRSEFSIERIGATRINPYKSAYTVTIKVTPRHDFNGTFVETVPASFELSNTGSGIVTLGTSSEKTIAWSAHLTAGDTQTYTYTYQAPQISPDIFLLGKATLQDEFNVIAFQEVRKWQIASDATCTMTTGTWNGTANANSGTGTAAWTGCTGGAGFSPTTGDTIQINSGITLTITGNAQVAGITMATPTVANQLIINDGFTLTDTGALTFNTNATAITSAVTLGSGTGAGNLTVGSISMAAPTGAVASLEKIRCSTNGTGTLTVSGAGTIAITGSSTTSNTGSASIDMSAGACNVVTGTGTNTLTAGTRGATPNAFIRMGTGTITFNNSLTFAGATASKSRLITANGTTISLNNATLPAVGSSGSYTITSATNLVSAGTSSIAYATAVSTWGTLTVNSGTLTLAAAAETFNGAVNIAGGTLSLGNTFTAASTTSVTGTISNTSSSTTKTFTGLVTVNSGGSINFTTATVPAVVIGAGVTTASGAGTVNFGTGATTFNNTTPTFSGPVNITIGATTIASGQTLTNNMSGTLTMSSVSISAPTSANGMSLATGSTTTTTTTLTFAANTTANAQTITMNGTANLNVTTNLVMSNAPTSTGNSIVTCAASATGTLAITGTASITGNSTSTGLQGIDMSSGGCNVTVGGLTTLTGGTNATGKAQMKLGTGNLTMSAGVTFAGTTLNQLLSTGSANTINFTGTWTNTTLPTLTINSGTTLKTTGITTLCATTGMTWPGNLWVASGTTSLALAETITGTTQITGTLQNSSGATAKIFTGLVTVNSGGSLNLNVTTLPTATFAGGMAIDQGATAIAITAATTFSGTQSITDGASGSGSWPNVTFGGTVAVSTGVTVTNSYTHGTVQLGTTATIATGNTGLTLATGSTTTITTSLTFTTNSTAGSAQLVTLQGTAVFNPAAITMPATTSTGTAKITATGSGGSMTVSGATAVTGSATASGGLSSIDFSATDTNFTGAAITITGGTVSSASFLLGTGTLTANGLFTLAGPASGTGLATLSTATGTIDINAGLTMSGTVIANAQLTTTGAATIILTGTMTGNGTISIHSTTTFSTTGTAAVNSACTLPTLNVLAGTTTTGAAITVSGATVVSVGATLTKGAAALTLSGTTTIHGSMTSSSATGTATFTGLLTVDGSFNLSGAATISVYAGGITVDTGATTFTAGTGTITFSATQTISGTGSIALGFSGATTISANALVTNSYTGGTVTFSTLTITGGNYSADTGLDLDTGTVTATTTTATIGANASTGGAFSDTITLNGTATLTIGTTLTMTIPTATFSGAKEGIIAASGASGNVSIGGTTTINGGATGTQFVGIDLSAGTNALSVAALTLTGGAGSAAKVLMSSGTFTSTGLITLTGASLNPSAVFTRTTGTMNIGAGLTFGGTVANTQLNTGASTINLTGTMTGAGTLSIASATFNTAGTSGLAAAYTLPNLNVGPVTSGTLTVGIAGTVTISGAFTVNSGSTVTFGTSGTIFTVNGTTTVSGTVNCSATSNACSGAKTFDLIDINSGGSFTFAGATGTMPTTVFKNGIQIDSGATTFNTGTGTTTFNTNSQSISSTGTITPTFGGATTISSGITLTIDYTGNVVTFSSTVTLSAGNTGLTLNGGTNTSTGTLTFTANSSAGTQELVTLVDDANLFPSAVTMPANTSTGTTKITSSGTSSGSLTVSGTTAITGSSTASGGLASIDFSGTGESANLGVVTITGGSTNAGKILMGSGSFSSSGLVTLSGNAAAAGDAIISADTAILDFNAGITFSGTLAQAQLTTTGATTIHFTGTWTGAGTLSWDPSTTFSCIGTVALNAAITYPIMTVASGTTTTGAAIVITNALAIADGATLSLGNFAFTALGGTTVGGGTSGILSVAGAGSTGTFTFGGVVDVNAGGTFDLTTGTHAVTFTGGITNDGATFDASTGATSFTTNSQNITGGSNTIFGGTITINSPIVVTNTGTVTTNGALNGTGGFTNSTNGSLTIALTIGITTLTATATNNTVVYPSAGQTIKGTTYYDLTLNNGGGSAQAYSINAGVTVNGTLTLASATEADVYSTGTLTMGNGSVISGGSTTTSVIQTQTGSSTITIGGTGADTINLDFTTVGGTTPTVVYNATSANQNVNSTTYYNLTISSSGVFANMVGAVTVNNNLSVTAGTFADNGYQITGNATGTFSISSGATISIGGTGSATTWPTSFTAGNTTINNNSTVKYAATVAQNISGTPTSYGNLQLSAVSGTPTKTMLGDITINGSLTVDASNTLDTGNYNIALGGNFTNNGGFTAGTGTVTLSGTTLQTVSGNLTSGDAFYDLSITNTTGSSPACSTSPLSTAGVAFAGNMTATHDFTIAQDARVEFNAGATYTFTNISWTGTSGHEIYLRSSSSGTPWDMSASGTVSITYVSVSNSNSSTSLNAYTPGHNSDCGGNTNWMFVPIITVSGTANGNNGATVNVAVNNTIQAQTATISGGTWTISGVAQPATNDIVTVWVTSVSDANETTGITKYSGSGNISGMVLDTNVFTVGSNQNTAVTEADAGQYDCSLSEDVMDSGGSGGAFLIAGTGCAGSVTNTYTNPTFSILASNTFTVGTAETLTSALVSNSGTLTLTGGGILTLTGTSGTLFTNPGTFNPGSTSQVIVTSASGTPTLLSTSTTVHILKIATTGATVVNLGAALTTDNNSGNKLWVNAGVLNQENRTITGGTAGTLQIDSGATFCLGGTTGATNATCDSGITQTTAQTMPSFSTYSFNAASTVAFLSNAATSVGPTPTYGNLKLMPKVTATRTYTLGASMSVVGDLTVSVSGGTLNTNLGGTLTVAGAVNVTTSSVVFSTTVSNRTLNAGNISIASGSTLSLNASAVTLSGTSGTLIAMTAGSTFSPTSASVTISSASGTPTFTTGILIALFGSVTQTGAATVSLAEDLIVSNTLTITAGTFDTTSGGHYPITAGNILINGGTLTTNSSTLTLTGISGTLINRSSGTFTANTSPVTVASALGTPTFASGLTAFTFASLTHSGLADLTLGEALTTNGQLEVADGTFTTSGYAVGAQNILVSGGTFTPSSSALTLSGTSGTLYEFTAGTITTNTAGITLSGNGSAIVADGHGTYIPLYSLTITGTGTKSLGEDLTIAGNLTISAGTLDVTVVNYLITLGGDFSNSGTFNARNGIVILNGSATQTVSGTFTGLSAFKDLTIYNTSGVNPSGAEVTGMTASVIFASPIESTGTYTITSPGGGQRIQYHSGDTYTFNNIIWDGNGGLGSSDNIFFRNSATSGTWLLDVSGTIAVNDLDVSRSDASAGSTILANDGTSTDSGNNTNWTFFVPIYSVTITAYGTVSYGALPASTSQDTITLGTTPIAQNDGNTTEKILIKGQDATSGACSGTPWTLVTGTPSTDTYKHEYSTDGGSTYTPLTTSYQILTASIAMLSTQNFDLQVTAPSGSTCTAAQSADITLMAVAP